MLNVRVGQIKS